MQPAVERTTLPSGFVIDHAAALAHVMQPVHTQSVISSRGLEEGTTRFAARIVPAGVTLSFNTDGFVAALNTALDNNTAGYVMQLRHQGKPIASAQGRLGQGAVRWIGVLGAGRPNAHCELQQVDHRHRDDAHARCAQPAGLDADQRLPAHLLGQGPEHRKDLIRPVDDTQVRLPRRRVRYVLQ